MKAETIVGLFILTAIGIFFYLSISIGSFRFDKDRYHFYKAYFDDTAGLQIKDRVKIAGVDLGWVSEIKLDPSGKAVVIFRIRKENKLAKNAYAVIRQEGLIGKQYLEVASGDSSTGILLPGSALGLPSQAPPTVGTIMNKFGDIADSINAVATSLKSAVATRQGEDNLKQAIEGFAKASESLASVTALLDRSLSKNEENINHTLSNFKDLTDSLKKNAPTVSDDLHTVASDLTKSVFPNFDDMTTKLASNTLPEFTTDFKDVSKKTGTAMEGVEDAAVQAREGFKEIEQVMDKVNRGKGLVGKLINEDETYSDFKRTIRNFKSMTQKQQTTDIMVDMHGENMIRDWNTKGYFELKIRPTQDYFYNIQLVVDERGSIKREEVLHERYDTLGTRLTTTSDFYPDRLERRVRTKYDTLFGFQFGKKFNRMALRLGLFESTFGVGIDYYVPLTTEKFHWVSTIEAFDFQGVNRLDDTRAHIKWVNRLFFFRNLYTTFGVDDLFSKKTASPFFGAGFKFGDKDLKYILPSLPVSALKS